jgi:hypothetical protein
MDKISQFASATPYMPTRLKLAETKVLDHPDSLRLLSLMKECMVYKYQVVGHTKVV